MIYDRASVIYRTHSERWNPEQFLEGMPGHESLERLHYDINHQQNTLVIVTARRILLDWAHLQEIYNWDWELFIVHWDEEQNLLFINSSSNSGYYKELAEAVAGEGRVELTTGAPVFRAFSGINRLRLQNVGLAEQLGRLIRYTMRAGSDVESGLTEAQRRNVRKSNIFGAGYENGAKASIGCSYKGRVWSRRTGDLESLVKWCKSVGRKVLDESIDPDQVLRGTLTPVPTLSRPRKMPIGIDWPDRLYLETETAYEFVLNDGLVVPLYEAELRLVEPAEDGDLKFELCTDDTSVAFTLVLEERDEANHYRYESEAGKAVNLRARRGQTPLSQFFYEYPPIIWFADGSSLEGNILTELKRGYPPYPAERIRVWDWVGIDITKESQGVARQTDSIQFRAIQELKKGNYDIIFDDDDSGEAADIIAVCVEEKSISVEFYHCKWSNGPRPGARIDDLYQVCGQAQKGVRWADRPRELFKHLLRRERRRIEQGLPTRFERGNQEELFKLVNMSMFVPVRIHVHIVQPGLSQSKASHNQLELLSVTENHLMETYKIPFTAIASD